MSPSNLRNQWCTSTSTERWQENEWRRPKHESQQQESSSVPSQWLFFMKEGDTLKTIKEARKLLKWIEKAHYMSKKSKTSSNKEKNQTSSKEEGPKENPTWNKCHLPGHNHPWKECPNNPGSNNFNGTHFKQVREESKNSTSINANEKGSGNQNTNEKSSTL